MRCMLIRTAYAVFGYGSWGNLGAFFLVKGVFFSLFDDFDPINHSLEGRTVKVWPIADVHIGSKECDLDGFKAFLRRVMADDNSYVVLCGDIINNGVKDSLTNVYEETMPPSEQIDLAVELLRPLSEAKKILGVVSGNHERRSAKQVDMCPMYAICCILRIQHLFRQNMAFVRIRFNRGGTRYNSYSMLLTHGKSANGKRRFAYAVEGVDAVITGHTHAGIVEKPARIVMTSKGVKVKSIVSVTATSWLSYGGYGASAMYLPQATSDPQYLELEFTGSHNKEGRIRVGW